jgi:hypothetical protein
MTQSHPLLCLVVCRFGLSAATQASAGWGHDTVAQPLLPPRRECRHHLLPSPRSVAAAASAWVCQHALLGGPRRGTAVFWDTTTSAFGTPSAAARHFLIALTRVGWVAP